MPVFGNCTNVFNTKVFIYEFVDQFPFHMLVYKLFKVSVLIFLYGPSFYAVMTGNINPTLS